MKKNMMLLAMSFVMVCSAHAASVQTTSTDSPVALEMNDGYYTKTGYCVKVICDTGTSKGYYDIYLHQGNRYIKFCGSWICIQGRQSFFYCGNRYILR